MGEHLGACDGELAGPARATSSRTGGPLPRLSGEETRPYANPLNFGVISVPKHPAVNAALALAADRIGTTLGADAGVVIRSSVVEVVAPAAEQRVGVGPAMELVRT